MTQTHPGAIPLGSVLTWGCGDVVRSRAGRLHWLLTLGVFLEFVGHGACGVATKGGWLPFFQVFAIPVDAAWKLMPLVGSVDIALGFLAVLVPTRALYLYLAVWGCFTALLRPASGQGWWEFIERAYNYGVPFALLVLHGAGASGRPWFAIVRSVPELTAEKRQELRRVLRWVVALMLIGHGGLGPFMQKGNLLQFYQAAGLGGLGLSLETIRAGVGFFEIGLGVAALGVTRPAFFVGICAWKLGMEALHLVAGVPLACWEVIERGGSYVAPLAVILVMALGPASRSALGAPNSSSGD